jgi:DNA-binding response OmpR family regulator
MLNVLIIEDVPGNKSERTLYHEYVNNIKGVVENLGYNVCIISKEEDFKKLPLYLDKAYDIAILDYDLRHFNTLENGWMYMRDIFEKNSHCDIALVTTDDKIADEINSLDPTIRDWISEKPNVKYISKTLEPQVFTRRVNEFVEDSITTRKTRAQLQKGLVACAVESYKTFLGRKVKDLTKKTSLRGDEPIGTREKEVMVKEDTMELDVIAEKAITKKFVSKIHEYGLVVCTEEGGVANSLIFRVDRPRFYILYF